MISSRIDNVTHLKPEFKQAFLPPPKSVKIELTGKCNFKCSFCAKSQHLRDTNEMDFELFKRLLKEIRQAGVEEIGLFYLGESFMSRNLEDAIKYAKDIGFPYVFLTTNGSLAKKERVEQCIRNGLDSLKFSLNYSDEAQFCDIARVNKSMFSKMIANIKEAKEVRDVVLNETGHKCGLYASYINYTGEQGEKMSDMVAEMSPYLDEIYGLPLYGQAGPQDSPVSNLAPTGGNTGRLDNPANPLPCWAVFQEGHITFDGKLSACCWDHNDGLSMADLNEVDFMTGWNSTKFQELRAAHLSQDVHNTPCEKCIYI